MKKILLPFLALFLSHSAFAFILLDPCELGLTYTVEGSGPVTVTVDANIPNSIQTLSLDWIYEEDDFELDGDLAVFTFDENGTYTVCAEATFNNDVCSTGYGCVDLDIDSVCDSNVGTITVFGGIFGNELSWELISGMLDTIASGADYPSNSTSVVPTCLADGCYTILMHDSFGDGWNAGEMTIEVDGETHSATVATGSEGFYVFSVGGADCGFLGCTDPEALNFDEDADTDNGTCVYPVPCNAYWTYSANGPYVEFANSSDGDDLEYLWDFGDGSSSVEEEPLHYYDQIGEYQVCLQITSWYCEEVLCKSVFVTDEEFIPCESNLISSGFNNSLDGYFYSVSEGTILAYEWDFGDGNSSTEDNPTHAYESTGVYTVCLTVFAVEDCEDIYCEELEVGICQSDFGNYGFDSSLTGEFYNWSNGVLESFLWDFGDGNSSTEEDPDHTYEEPGVYTVCITVFGVDGCEDTFCEETDIAVCEAHWIQLGFFNDLSGEFIDCSNGLLESYFWDFGDGNTTTEENPEHTYEEPGIYTVCHTIYTTDGCESTECAEVEVTAEEVVSDTTFLDTECDQFNYFIILQLQPWGDEVFWQISDVDGNVLLEGEDYEYNAFYIEEICLPTDCFTLTIFDVDGDNWDGSVFAITDTDWQIVVEGTLEDAQNSVSTECAQEPLTLCGNVSTGNEEHDQEVLGRVHLIHVDPDDESLNIVETVLWGQGIGSYCFDVSPEDKYFIKADLEENSPYFGEYFPTYFLNVLSWEDSPRIVVGDESFSVLDLTLIANSDSAPGEGMVDGMVEPGPGKVGEEIGEILVYLTDMDGNPVDFSWLTEEGYFMIDELAAGEYWLHVDVLGAQNEPVLITISEEELNWNYNFLIYSETLEVNSWSVSGNEASGLETISSETIQAYPNPVTDFLMIALDGNWQTRVVNLQGQVISTNEIISANGRLEISTAELPTGRYLIQVIQNNQQAIISFVKQ